MENPKNDQKERREINTEKLFSDKLAQKIWIQYFRRVKRFSKSINFKLQEELKLEIQGHLYESFNRETGESEAETLLNAIDKIGDPEEYIKPMVAERLLIDASQTFNPKMIAQGLYYHIWGSVKNFLSSLIFFFGYSIVLTLGLLTILKIILPQYVGIFLYNNGGHSIGFDANSVNATEVLGYWFIPIGIFLTVILYMGLTRLLKVLKKGSKYKEIEA